MKSSKISAVIGFVLGAGVGVGATWYITKDYYSKKAQEEIDSVKTIYENHFAIPPSNEESDTSEEDSENKSEEKDISEYAAIIRESNYKTDYNAISKKSDDSKTDDEEKVVEDSEEKITIEKEPILEPGEKPYVIYPEEFGDYEDYRKISLTHYSDGTLADLNDCIIDDVEGTVGSDYAEHIGDYEDDAVHIRNDATKCDYEILYDERTWDDILKSKPYLKTED